MLWEPFKYAPWCHVMAIIWYFPHSHIQIVENIVWELLIMSYLHSTHVHAVLMKSYVKFLINTLSSFSILFHPTPHLSPLPNSSSLLAFSLSHCSPPHSSSLSPLSSFSSLCLSSLFSFFLVCLALWFPQLFSFLLTRILYLSCVHSPSIPFFLLLTLPPLSLSLPYTLLPPLIFALSSLSFPILLSRFLFFAINSLFSFDRWTWMAKNRSNAIYPWSCSMQLQLE